MHIGIYNNKLIELTFCNELSSKCIVRFEVCCCILTACCTVRSQCRTLASPGSTAWASGRDSRVDPAKQKHNNNERMLH